MCSLHHTAIPTLPPQTQTFESKFRGLNEAYSALETTPPFGLYRSSGKNQIYMRVVAVYKRTAARFELINDLNIGSLELFGHIKASKTTNYENAGAQ